MQQATRTAQTVANQKPDTYEVLKNCLTCFGDDIARAEWGGKLKGVNFVGFADTAKKVAGGLEVLMQLLRASHLARESFEDGDGEELLNRFDEGQLMALAEASLGMLASDADDLADRCNKRLKEFGASHVSGAAAEHA